MAKPTLLCLMLAVGLILSATARATDAINPESWLTPDGPIGDASLPVQNVSGMVVPQGMRLEASGLLMAAQIVELNYEQARHLLGTDPSSILGALGGRPYLVRGVSPNSAGRCDARLQGNVLSIFCGSLGDFNYELRPMIVFLRQAPANVSIGAMTAR